MQEVPSCAFEGMVGFEPTMRVLPLRPCKERPFGRSVTSPWRAGGTIPVTLGVQHPARHQPPPMQGSGLGGALRHPLDRARLWRYNDDHQNYHWFHTSFRCGTRSRRQLQLAPRSVFGRFADDLCDGEVLRVVGATLTLDHGKSGDYMRSMFGKSCNLTSCEECGLACRPRGHERDQSLCNRCRFIKRARYRGKAMGRRYASEKAGDDITWGELGERDKWRCHICGDRVLKRAGKAKQPRGATVDHLIPIADGGTHTWDNVALAHRSCNTSRGAGGIAQLRLTG